MIEENVQVYRKCPMCGTISNEVESDKFGIHLECPNCGTKWYLVFLHEKGAPIESDERDK